MCDRLFDFHKLYLSFENAAVACPVLRTYTGTLAAGLWFTLLSAHGDTIVVHGGTTAAGLANESVPDHSAAVTAKTEEYIGNEKKAKCVYAD